MARIDADAALELIAENHPGARPEVSDAAFLNRLEAARAHLAARLPLVRDYAGYSALLAGLATDFGDGHIWSNGQLSPRWINWAGLASARRGGRWVVARDFNEGGRLTDAELLSCDGTEAEALGRERIGQFRADPAVEADLAKNGYALLLDEGNPYLANPVACTFRTAGGEVVEQALEWRAEQTTQVLRKLGETVSSPRAGMGVTSFAGGYWIALETLDPSAEAVVEQVRAMQDELRAAPMVVLDLRGNGGGNSTFANQIADVLAGVDSSTTVRRRGLTCAGEFWRASPGNAAAMRALADEATGERRERLDGLATRIEQAVVAGEAFSPPLPACARGSTQAYEWDRPTPKLAMRGRLAIVTDRACFSSCLLAARTFRRLGALHVGEATDRSTRYMEVRETVLPSGLRTFSTLMKLALGVGDFGPYEPDVPYPGDLADSAALKAWVAALPLPE